MTLTVAFQTYGISKTFMGTPILIKPTLDEVRLQAQKIGLPDLEAQKFYHYYESNGWKVGRNKMVSFSHALQHWKIVWQEHNGNTSRHMTGADVVILGREYERILQRMQAIKGTYSSHQGWTEEDVAQWRKLVSRRDELRGILGIRV